MSFGASVAPTRCDWLTSGSGGCQPGGGGGPIGVLGACAADGAGAPVDGAEPLINSGSKTYSPDSVRLPSNPLGSTYFSGLLST